jgi:hypothetical protein
MVSLIDPLVIDIIMEGIKLVQWEKKEPLRLRSRSARSHWSLRSTNAHSTP